MRYLITLLLLLLLGVVTTAQAEPPVRLMSAAQEQLFLQHFPETDDDEIAEILAADDLILYTEQEIPRAYQNANSFHDAYHNLSAEPDPFGNGNREFPWNVAGGTDNVRNSRVFRFVRFPKADNGRYWPMVIVNQKLPYYGRELYDSHIRWVYPKGTVFGELLAYDAPNGYTYAYEMRFRIREADEWGVNVLRPFPAAEDLAKRIKELRPQWQQSQDLLTLVSQLEGTYKFPSIPFSDNSSRAFRGTAKMHQLPPIEDHDLVAELLRGTIWRSALAESWKEDSSGGYVEAPTTQAAFHIVPRGYTGGFFGVDRESCMDCHQHTNKAVAAFQMNRGWYGRIRGSDGILSFHPVAKQSISSNGFNLAVRYNPALVQAGLVEQYQANRHPAEMYQMLDPQVYQEGK